MPGAITVFLARVLRRTVGRTREGCGYIALRIATFNRIDLRYRFAGRCRYLRKTYP